MELKELVSLMNEWEELELKMGFLEIWVYCER